jgi:ribosomal protein S18 acetylase RimI-like enzyme
MMEIRKLGPGDEGVVRALATRPPHFELLADERTIFLVAFEDREPIGFAFAYVLPRRHGPPTTLFVYEIGVEERYRGRGIGKELMQRLAAEGGAEEGFVLTEPGNDAANALYRSVRGTPSDVVQWDFDYTGS